jgi:hypothetical protein
MTNRFPTFLSLIALTALSSAALAPAPALAQCSFRGLNGDWRANDGGTYRIHEQGNRVWWIAMSGDGGRSWQHKFQGTRSGDIVTGNWADFRGPMGRGTLTIRVRDVMSMRRIANTGSGFGGVRWWRGCNDTAGGPGSD